MKHVAILGAGGKMGMRISENLRDDKEYEVSHIEVSKAGIQRLKEKGFSVVPQQIALETADVVILAIPDILIGTLTKDIIPLLKKGTMVFSLDPAAAYAQVIPVREDLTYFVAHPSHPPIFNNETNPLAQKDYFGGIAHQSAVCALYHGSEDCYGMGETLTRKIYAPVKNTYRITVEQMVILEPALVETFSSTLIEAMKEAFDQIIEMGVPRDAALDFFMGHARIQFAVLFGYADFTFSDGALLAMREARSHIFKEDWKEKIFNIDSIKKSVNQITSGIKK